MGREGEGSQVERQMRGVREESRLQDLHVVSWAAINLRGRKSVWFSLCCENPPEKKGKLPPSAAKCSPSLTE